MTEPTSGAAEDKYDSMMSLADLFDAAGAELRHRARLGAQILADVDLRASAELSPATFARVEADLRAATTGRSGLQSRSVELDADALVVRATVLTYRWIDELQEAAYHSLGALAGRAIGHLAPEVALGGALAGADPGEAAPLDGAGVAAFLSDVAQRDPGLVEHVTSGRGGLLESLQLRSQLTLGSSADPATASLGVDALGVPDVTDSPVAALRDVAATLLPPEPGRADREPVTEPPAGLAGLMAELAATTTSVRVERVARGRYVAYLPGPHVGQRGLRLVADESGSYADRAAAAIAEATSAEPDARVLLVGRGQGGVAAARLAAAGRHPGFIVDTVLTSAAPGAQVPRLPASVRMLALEERTDPVALLGAVLNAGEDNRMTIVFDRSASAPGEDACIAGARLADQARHPELGAELTRLRATGFLEV